MKLCTHYATTLRKIKRECHLPCDTCLSLSKVFVKLYESYWNLKGINYRRQGVPHQDLARNKSHVSLSKAHYMNSVYFNSHKVEKRHEKLCIWNRVRLQQIALLYVPRATYGLLWCWLQTHTTTVASNLVYRLFLRKVIDLQHVTSFTVTRQSITSTSKTNCEVKVFNLVLLPRTSQTWSSISGS